MEASAYFYDSYCRGCNPKAAMEKQGLACDHFVVEDLLDFTEDDCFGEGDEVALDNAPANSADGSMAPAVGSNCNSFSGYGTHFSSDLGCRSFVDAGLSDDLCAPYDELAELEWLSNFVEESFSIERLHLISGVKSSSSSSSDTRSGVSTAQASALLRPERHVPGKARSKRSRPAPTSWSSRLLVLSPVTSEHSKSAAAVAPATSRAASAAKKSPKPAKRSGSAGPAPAADGRKCLHCATDRTPQWRAGPMGPKTLCNACGVRYKSGRLVPEYRPAASPTFVLWEHSNSHRKVLELRRQKDLLRQHNGSDQIMHPGRVYETTPAGGVGAQFSIHHRVGRPDLSQLA